ncbi:hypothetical protein CU098_004575 [Rhizopus stolonifer]|uniref:Glutathione S-transferase n=1 Tax=Rhizopus stolonifer TaxID=4846 RepID=A0A367J2L6_RHIST|nr:hypothetical protein CU098_004575 [Rhizopus stolonifer]
MSKLTLVGAPFSTFSRTLRMAFDYLGIHYDFEITMPHTDLAYKYNLFGRLPSLIHSNRVLFETACIRDYVDAVFDPRLTPTDLETRLKMHQMISVLSDYVFHQVIFGVAKRREKYENEQVPEETIVERLEKATQTAGKIIGAFDTMCSPEGPFLCGKELTWADYFVYPPMADLYALPEAKFFQEKGPRLYKWFKVFEKRQEAIDTFEDTVADIRNKKRSSL